MASGVIAEDVYKVLEDEMVIRLHDLEARFDQLANLDKVTEKEVKKALGMIQRAPALWSRLDLESMLALQSALFPNGITISQEGELTPIETPLMRVCRLLEPANANAQCDHGTWNRKEHGLNAGVSSSSEARPGRITEHRATTETQPLGTTQVACESTTCDVSEGAEENLVPQARLERATCGLGNRRSIL